MSVSTLTILDGGMGRELHRIGAPFRQPEWSALALMEAPETVRQVHDSYVLAGADVLTTNSYALVPFHIGEERFSARGQELADLAGQLGRAAVTAAASGRGVRLAGSLPPLFGSYRPDLFRPEEVERLLRPLIAGLSPYVDLWLAETQGSVIEARAIRTVIGPEDTRPFWLSFTLEDANWEAVVAGQAVPTLRSGESLEEAVQAALDLGVAALLFNCSHADIMEVAVRKVAALLSGADAPQIGVYANAFAPTAHKHGANEAISDLRHDLSPEDYLRFARRWQDAGATVIGGCCGIGPDYISALSSALRG